MDNAKHGQDRKGKTGTDNLKKELSQREILKELADLYSGIHSRGIAAIQNGEEQIDQALNQSEKDTRLGLTLQIGLNSGVTQEIGMIGKAIAKIAPLQYFYPAADLHVTVLDLISANREFKRDEAQIRQFITIIDRATCDLSPFMMVFKGLIVSNGAILIKGYYTWELRQLRGAIRQRVYQEGVEMKERYQSLSAHVTMIRFKSRLQNRAKLLEVIEGYRDWEIGSLRVDHLELVIHDWYNRKKEILHRFSLKSNVTS